MGDIIKFTTLSREQQTIYEAPTGGIKFSVKGPNNAAIGLLSNPNLENTDFWILLGKRQRTYIKSSDFYNVECTPDILSEDEYRSFWVSWSGPCISIGRDGEEVPIVTYPAKYNKHNKNIRYVTFFANTDNAPIHWIVELPPEIPRPIEEKPIGGGKVQWVRCGNQVPWNAVIGGYEHETLYIIRAPHRGSLAIGKFVPSKGLGYIAWGSMSHEKGGDELEFLVGYDCQWVRTSGNKIPVNAIIGGHTEHHPSEHIYIGRARCKNHLIPGKVHKMYSNCYTPYDGKEVSHADYEVLVSSEINRRSVNRKFGDRVTVSSPDGSSSNSDVEDSNDGPVFAFAF